MLNSSPPRQSYLQFHVPLDLRARWYKDARAALSGVKGVRWQNGNFHFTVAFFGDDYDVAKVQEVAEILNGELMGTIAPRISFDKLDAFTGQDGKGNLHYLNLTASHAPEEWDASVEKVRTKLKDCGYKLGPFRTHVTLARIPVGSISLEDLMDRIGRVKVPSFTLTLNKADYTYRNPYDVIREWTFPVR